MIGLANRIGLAALVVGLVAASAGRSEAAFITYTETAIASGSLGATNFTNALVTITGTADTNNVTAIGSSFFSVPVVATVAVANVGFGTLTDFVQVASGINGLAQTGFITRRSASDPSSFALLFIQSPTVANYDLKSSIGPITTSSFSSFPGRTNGTTVGDFVITGFPTNATSTFTAITGAAVPEPSSLVLMGIGGITGLVYARRRRRAQVVA